jgi:lysozyme
MTITERGLALIKEFEGCRLEAYQDSVGVWTIGYGHTRGVTEGMTCTQEQADKWLDKDVCGAESAVMFWVEVALSSLQFDALVSFVYNLGPTKFRGSTLLQRLNERKYVHAADEFLRWNKAGGKVVAGLTRRRQAERELFLEGTQ